MLRAKEIIHIHVVRMFHFTINAYAHTPTKLENKTKVQTIPEMTYNVFSGTLNPTHSLTHPRCKIHS